MGRDSIQKFLDEFDINSKIYVLLVFISVLFIAAIMLINNEMKYDSYVDNLQAAEKTEVVVPQ